LTRYALATKMTKIRQWPCPFAPDRYSVSNMPHVSRLEQLLTRVFEGASEGLRDELDSEEYEKRKHDFVFHMTDWIGDLEQLVDLFRNPDQEDEEAASKVVLGFLYHVVPHLNAAGRLLLDDVGDPFSPHKGG
jgi:hypothetical protein